MRLRYLVLLVPLAFTFSSVSAQPPMQNLTSGRPLDPFPARSPTGTAADPPYAQTPERYIWAKDDRVVDRLCFRSRFDLKAAPKIATLYVAGPDRATIYLNGRQIGQFARAVNSGIRPVVFTVALAGKLRVGSNVIAIDAAPIHNPSYMPREYMLLRGSYLVVKIVPGSEGIDRKPILVSDPSWVALANPVDGWEAPAFDDSSWPHVQSHGPMEGDIDNYQWNADGGLYRWPGYTGVSNFLRHITMSAAKVIDPIAAASRFEHLEALTRDPRSPKKEVFSIDASAGGADPTQSPSLVLDFGQELVGRLHVRMHGGGPAQLLVQYGESLEEAQKKPYLGELPLLVNPGVDTYAQKSAFRYVFLRFANVHDRSAFVLDADAIYYPVAFTGSFESSDAQLNRIWEVGAYTAHLCMQDSIWDAPKRDRGRWTGDLEVSGRVIETAFDDRYLMEDTLRRLNDFPPGGQKDVNGIPGYSAMWVMGLADYYRHTGAKPFLISMAPHLQSLLEHMRGDLDKEHLFSTDGGAWPFIDWSRDLAGPTAEAKRATTLEYFRAFRDGAYLLREAGEANAAALSENTAALLRGAANRHLTAADGTFGDRWQTNAMAIYSGLADEAQTRRIREQIFTQIDSGHLPPDDVSPYYGSYILDAMAKAGDRAGALRFMRQWWGGMIDEGATSFWEGYDPRWPKDDFHANLHADGAQGYFVSLAHGWSAGPTAWLTEQLLGIKPMEAGFSKISVRPDLLGLTYARGSEATPHGIVRVDASAGAESGPMYTLILDLPDGIDATVSLPVTSTESGLWVDGRPAQSTLTEAGTRRELSLAHGGHYVITTKG